MLHGTWIPDDGCQFAQGGAFYLWVETDGVEGLARRGKGDHTHSRSLPGPALEAFLKDAVGLRDPASGVLMERWFTLPTADDEPLPSLEMARYLGQDLPEECALGAWRVTCYRVGDHLKALKDLHYLAQSTPAELIMGADLLYWYHYAQAFKGVIARDRYIPALVYRELPPEGKKKKGRPEVLPSWEIVSADYQSDVAAFAAAMPLACAAGWPAEPPSASMHGREGLLRHFAEITLRGVVTGSGFTAKIDDAVVGSLVYRCLHPLTPVAELAGGPLEEYRQWRGWRDKIAQAHTAASFTLCLQLLDAPGDDPDGWQVRFLVAARDDPSLRLPLEDYWGLRGAAKKSMVARYGVHFERDLLLALGYAARIYPKIWEGMATAQPVGFRLTLEEAFAFLAESAWVLEDAGYTVTVPAWWTPQGRRKAKVRLRTQGGRKAAGSAATKGYFSLDAVVRYDYELAIGGQTVSEAEWATLVAAKAPLVHFRGEWMQLDRERMAQMLEFWRTRGHEEEHPLTVAEVLRMMADGDEVEVAHDDALADMLALLHDKSRLQPIADPPGLHGTLRDYQRRGVAWLQYLESLGLNPCLADDMGLGKTIQVIAQLVNDKESMDGDDGGAGAPTLLIAPTSVLGNWRKEVERFAPHLRVLVHHGAGRIKGEAAFAGRSRQHDVVVTSYPLARMDEKLLRAVRWRRIVVDEAQNIKNPQAAQTRAILKLSAPRRLALTGTPVENRLLDLWSIFNFLNPGYLGKEAQFRKLFETPIQKESDPIASAMLKKLVEPFILRRLKTDKQVIADLPDKVEQKVYCNLTREQASLYEAVVRDVDAALEQAEEGMARRGLILATLTRLKQICNHPAQFLGDGSAFSPERSHKLARLLEMVDEVLSEGESMLIFTQYTEIGEALESYFKHTLHYTTHYLHGGTSRERRERMIAQFQDDQSEPSVFILSLRAGGVGITLTRANHVFHFDRWWNPAVEDQATDRAFRIGQRKNVFVHKFVALGTLEERIDAMIEDKKKLAGAIVGSDESWLTELDNETFKGLIALNREAILE